MINAAVRHAGSCIEMEFAHIVTDPNPEILVVLRYLEYNEQAFGCQYIFQHSQTWRAGFASSNLYQQIKNQPSRLGWLITILFLCSPLLWLPAAAICCYPVAVPGERPRRKRPRPSPTAATRSPPSSRHRRRSDRSPDFHWLRQFKSVSTNKKSAIPVGMTDFLELLARFELATSSLPRMRSTGWAIAAFVRQLRYYITDVFNCQAFFRKISRTDIV